MSNVNKTPAQELEEQKQRLARLQDRRTRIAVRLESEQEALTAARAEAEATFGTSDIQALRDMYNSQLTDNELKVLEFTSALDTVEAQLQNIERQINF